jgi:hypothetical protein
LERGNELLVGQEIRRGDPDRMPRQIDRGQKDQNQLIDLLVRPRRRSCAPPIRGSPAPDAPSLSPSPLRRSQMTGGRRTLLDLPDNRPGTATFTSRRTD